MKIQINVHKIEIYSLLLILLLLLLSTIKMQKCGENSRDDCSEVESVWWRYRG